MNRASETRGARRFTGRKMRIQKKENFEALKNISRN